MYLWCVSGQGIGLKQFLRLLYNGVLVVAFRVECCLILTVMAIAVGHLSFSQDFV